MTKKKIDLPAFVANVGELSEQVSDSADTSLDSIDGDDVALLRSAQRYYVLMARDATAAASRLYSAINIAESKARLRKVE